MLSNFQIAGVNNKKDIAESYYLKHLGEELQSSISFETLAQTFSQFQINFFEHISKCCPISTWLVSTTRKIMQNAATLSFWGKTFTAVYLLNHLLKPFQNFKSIFLRKFLNAFKFPHAWCQQQERYCRILLL
jgi:hypothetical protein